MQVLNEIQSIYTKYDIWFLLGTQDIKLRYRRSSLGPFWITISMAVTIYTMGFLYGHLFKVDIQHYFPYLAGGIIGWSFISTSITESTNAFIEAENYIKNQDTVLSIFILRIILRNIIIFGHNILVFIPLIFVLNLKVNFYSLLLIPGLLLISLNVYFWGTFLAVIGTRFRDFTQIINSLIQVIFFATPIMWLPTLLPEKYVALINFNPFYHFLNLIRQPLLGNPINELTLFVVSLFSLLGLITYHLILKKYKQRVVFWL